MRVTRPLSQPERLPVLPIRGRLGIATLFRDVLHWWPLRRVRLQYGSGADARTVPALPCGRHGLADGLAAHLRRRGTRLGRRAGDDRAGPEQLRVRGPL